MAYIRVDLLVLDLTVKIIEARQFIKTLEKNCVACEGLYDTLPLALEFYISQCIEKPGFIHVDELEFCLTHLGGILEINIQLQVDSTVYYAGELGFFWCKKV